MVNLCFDDIVSSPTLGYPNLAKPGLGPDDFDSTWPRVTPLRLQVYFERFGLDYQVWSVDHAPVGSWYPVSWGWHDFECDYFGLMSQRVHQRLRQTEIRVFFYYHEGDNPQHIIDHLDSLCHQHRLPRHCYLLISANSAADQLDRACYFPDHEYFLQYVNRYQRAPAIYSYGRDHDFTVLNRTHKWWRAACMVDLLDRGLLDRSFWSYNTQCLVDDLEQDNPIQIGRDHDWQKRMHEFVNRGPYWCDSPDAGAHNDHRVVNLDLWQKSYCHVVIETLFDADQSGGAFITEKTYKCIKYGQPFVIVGTAGSLEQLRRRGYRVFDHVIDNSYDLIQDNTQRWLAVRQVIENLKQQDLEKWFLECLPDLQHNQQHFMRQEGGAVETLWQRLAANSHSV